MHKNVIAGNFVFGFVLILFISLLTFHITKNLKIWPTTLVLVLHTSGIFLFYNISYHPVWNRLSALLFE